MRSPLVVLSYHVECGCWTMLLSTSAERVRIGCATCMNEIIRALGICTHNEVECKPQTSCGINPAGMSMNSNIKERH